MDGHLLAPTTPHILRMGPVPTAPNTSVEALFNAWFSALARYDDVYPKIRKEGRFYDIPAGTEIAPGTEIMFLSRLFQKRYSIRNFMLSNARKRIGEYALDLHIKGQVHRRQIPGGVPGDTYLDLLIKAREESVLESMINRIRSDGGEQLHVDEVEDGIVWGDLSTEIFRVHSSGPRRNDDEDSMETASDASFSVISPKNGSADVILGLR